MNQNASVFSLKFNHFAPKCALLKHNSAQHSHVFPDYTPSPPFSDTTSWSA